MSWGFDTVKAKLVECVRAAVYPAQLDYGGSINAASGVYQPFIPFRTVIDAIAVYSHTSGDAVIQLSSGGQQLYYGAVNFNIGWNTINTALTSLDSKAYHTITVIGNVELGASAPKYYFDLNRSYNLAFKAIVPDYVFPVYPLIEQYKLSSLPIIALDLVSRPAVYTHHLSPRTFVSEFEARVEVYSRYPDEIDKLSSAIDYGMVKLNSSLPPKWLSVTPAAITEISFISPEIFFRDLRYRLSILCEE